MENGKRNDPDSNDPESRLALVLLRYSRLFDQGELARRARVAPSQISVYERGERAAPREVLEKVAAAVDFPLDLLDPLLQAIRSFRAAAKGKSRADRVLTDGISAELNALIRQAADVILEPLFTAPARKEPLAATALWFHLEGCSTRERLMLVQELEEYWSWELCVRAAAESVRAAPNQPREALELAELALSIAELVPGEETWRLRLQGYVWAFVCNGRRACNNLPGADEAIARAWKLWEIGAPGDMGLLNPAWLPWIEAALRRDQRRFEEALKRIEEALMLDRGELRGEILLSKSAIFQILQDPESSAEALAEAASWIDPSREPRNAFGLRFNLVVDHCHLGRFEKAEPRLPEVRALAERLGEELDLTRVAWLEGKVAAGLGQTTKSRVAFEQARRVFSQRELAYDYALVSLDLALLLLDEGATAEVRILAEEMLWIFRAQKLERESLAALRVFCDAAKRQAATANLARRVMKFLHRAQYDPELRFADTVEGAGAQKGDQPRPMINQ